MLNAHGGRLGRILLGAAALAVTIACVLDFAHADGPGKKKPVSAPAPSATKRVDVDNPIVQLVRDPQVRKELDLKAPQVEALDAAYAKIQPRLFLLRDVGMGPGAEEKAGLLASLETELEKILDRTQTTRLRQLVVRGRGWSGITLEPAASQLQLSPQQFGQIEKIIGDTRQAMQKIGASSDPPDVRNAATVKARTEEGTSIQILLSAEQRQLLGQLVGAPFDLSEVRPLSFLAPELRGVDAWINTPPLKLEGLRGKVVAFHFWAFNCGNCVNNLPHYTKWHDQFASQGLVVIGMHTPETMAERNVDTLRSKLDEHAIRYPVAMDREAANWSAWANSMWPSVYLVDKQGHVRYWWYGEMNWQGTEGEQFMRRKIEQLLAEQAARTGAKTSRPGTRTFTADEHHPSAEPRMPRKPSPKKKNGPAAARKQTKTPAAKRPVKTSAAPPSAAFYVTVSPPRVAIVREKPAQNGAAGPCPTFEQAKTAAIDALVAAIEEAERQLARCKRANSAEELRTT